MMNLRRKRIVLLKLESLYMMKFSYKINYIQITSCSLSRWKKVHPLKTTLISLIKLLWIRRIFMLEFMMKAKPYFWYIPYHILYKDFIDVTMYNNDTLSIHDIKVALNRKEVKKKVSKSGEGNSSEDLVIEGVQERKIMRGKVNLDLNQSSRETTNVFIATKKIL